MIVRTYTIQSFADVPDFRFLTKSGEYTNRRRKSGKFGRAAGQDPVLRRRDLCPSCGLLRSVTGKCDCNS